MSPVPPSAAVKLVNALRRCPCAWDLDAQNPYCDTCWARVCIAADAIRAQRAGDALTAARAAA